MSCKISAAVSVSFPISYFFFFISVRPANEMQQYTFSYLNCKGRHKSTVMLLPRLIEFLMRTFHFVGVNEDKDHTFLIITFHETKYLTRRDILDVPFSREYCCAATAP